MARDNKKAKTNTALKADSTPKADTAAKSDAAEKVKSPAAEDASKSKAEDPAAAAPANYSRGEGQKPVTAAYKENWNAIFAKKTKSKKKNKR
ncbi:MAG: hypothetical protein WBD95_17445 [Xanthobacteraceae bacterium]